LQPVTNVTSARPKSTIRVDIRFIVRVRFTNSLKRQALFFKFNLNCLCRDSVEARAVWQALPHENDLETPTGLASRGQSDLLAAVQVAWQALPRENALETPWAFAARVQSLPAAARLVTALPDSLARRIRAAPKAMASSSVRASLAVSARVSAAVFLQASDVVVPGTPANAPDQ
jgi:hypothetical protein